jgi:hypothetical protein
VNRGDRSNADRSGLLGSVIRLRIAFCGESADSCFGLASGERSPAPDRRELTPAEPVPTARRAVVNDCAGAPHGVGGLRSTGKFSE